MVRILSDGDVASLLDIDSLLPVVREAFVKQGHGEVERPDRPHFPVGTGLTDDAPLGTGLVMPAYIHGATHYATKLVGVHEGNADRGLPTVNAQIALTEAETGSPAAFIAGTRITNARTGCIGGLAAAELAASSPVTLGVIGAGTQARWQARCITAATEVESIRIYSPSDSKYECANELESELGVPTTAVESAAEAVSNATVVVTATTATSPVFSGDALEPGTLVVAVGAYTAEMRELDRETFERAGKIIADVPEEVAGIGDVLATDLGESDFVSLADVLEGKESRESESEIVVVESVGSAVLDAAASEFVIERASETGTGEEVEL